MNENTIKYVSVISSVLILYIFSRIREYLGEIPKCSCYKKTDTHDSIDRLRFITIIIMGFIILSALLNLYNPQYVINSKAYIFIVPIISIVYLLYVYNVHDYRHKIEMKCDECADKWPKYAMYGTSLVYALTLSLFLLSFIILAVSLPLSDRDGMMSAVSLLFLVGLVAWTFMGGSINDFVDNSMEVLGYEGFKQNALEKMVKQLTRTTVPNKLKSATNETKKFTEKTVPNRANKIIKSFFCTFL